MRSSRGLARRGAALSLVLLAGPWAPAAVARDDLRCENARTGTSELALKAVRSAFTCLVNAERAADGLSDLVAEGALERTASGHSTDMVRRRFFSHSSSTGGTLLTRVKRTGYLKRARRWSLGETLAYGRGDVTASRLFGMLMASPTHRAVLRNGRYRQLGVGLRRGVPSGSGGGLTVTLDFAVVSTRG